MKELLSSVAMPNHVAEYPAFSDGENFSRYRPAASPGGSQSEPLFTRAF
jgi:hypothetical protein